MYLIDNRISHISVTDYMKNYRDKDKFIAFCKECDKYNNCWACPPFAFDTEEYLHYKNAYIIGTKITLSKKLRSSSASHSDSKRIGEELIAEVRKTLDNQLLAIENNIPQSRAFFAGTCHLCPTEGCTQIKGKVCRHPDLIRPSLEGFGFDIGKTTKELLGIELLWSSDGSLPEYLTLVSGLFSNIVVNDMENYF